MAGNTSPPRYDTPFVGRQRLRRRLEVALEQPCGLWVVGEEGVGKTRLLAECLGAPYEEGEVLFVALDEVLTPEAFLGTLCAALGMNLSAGGYDDRCRRVGGWLVGRPERIVVLDGVDEVAEAVSRALAGWSLAAKAWVVTCRTAAAAPSGTTVVEVGPIDSPPANLRHEESIRSFPGVELAMTLVPGRVARRVHSRPADVAALVRAAGSVPQCLELACVRLASMRLQDVVTSLSAATAAGSGPVLEAGLRWCWDLLRPWEQRALCQVSVFGGSFDLAGAEAVLRPGPDLEPLDALHALVRHRLVRVDRSDAGRPRRYRLSRSVQVFAGDRLAESGDTEVIDRVCGFYERAGRTLWERIKVHGEFAAGMSALRFERHGLARAADEAIARRDPRAGWTVLALGLLLRDEGAGGRAQELAEVLLGWGDLCDPVVRGHLHLLCAAMDRGSSRAADHCDRALQAVEQVDAPYVVGAVHIERAWGLEHDPRAQREELSAAAALDAPTVQITARMMLALDCDWRSGEHQAALDQLTRCAQMSREGGYDRLWSVASAYLGHLLTDLGQLDRAAQALQESAARFDVISDPQFRCDSLAALGLVRALSGHHAAAAAAFDEARAVAEARGSMEFVALTQSSLAVLAAIDDEAPRAAALADAVLVVIDGVDDPRFVVVAAAYTAAVLAWLGDVVRYDAMLEVIDRRGASVVDRLGGLPHACRAMLVLMRWRAALARGDLDIAREAAGTLDVHLEAVKGGSPQQGLILRLVDRVRAETAAPEAAWLIASDGQWFQPPGGDRIDLSRRASLMGILGAFAKGRRRGPESTLHIPDLVAAGWPGQALVEKAGKNRAYVAISTLRKAGLTVVVRRGGGWCLDPELPVVVVDGAPGQRI